MFNNNARPMPMEKIVSIASYITMGLVGFLFLLIVFFTKLGLKPFLRFHIYQSIFLSLLFSVIIYLFGPLTYYIAPLNRLFNVHIIGSFTITNIFILCLTVYLCIGVLLDKYSYIPWVSDVIKYHVK